MRWTRRGRSRYIEDRRAETGGRRRLPFPVRFPRAGGGTGRTRAAAPRLSLGGLLILVLFAVCFREQFAQIIASVPQGQLEVPPVGAPGSAPETLQTSEAEEELVEFVSFVLDDLQATWSRTLPGYEPARLVLFRDAVGSACGFAQSAMGPFYCPLDRKVYIDLSFYQDLRRRFGAPGDFAQAYVVAHEIGHHVQNLLGTAGEVRRAQERNPRRANELSVRLELQADCLAGVWGHSTARRDILERGDVEEGLDAAAAIGDDRMQQMSQGRVVPDAFTHGSSEQRVYWFRHGLETGDPQACNTFSAGRP